MRYFILTLTFIATLSNAFASENGLESSLQKPIPAKLRTALASFPREIQEYAALDPKAFATCHKINFDVINKIRAQYKGCNEAQERDLDSRHNEHLLPLVEEWLEFFTTSISSNKPKTIRDVAQHFVEEINDAIKHKRVSDDWSEGIPFRYVLALSASCEAEIDTYTHVLKSKVYAKFFKLGNLWKDPLASTAVASELEFEKKLYLFLAIDPEQGIKLMKRYLEPLIENTFNYPVRNHRFFDLAELIYLSLDNIYLIAFPSYAAQSQVHGMGEQRKVSFLPLAMLFMMSIMLPLIKRPLLLNNISC